MKKLAISIGAFRARPMLQYPSVEGYLTNGFRVLAFDPRKDVYEEYLEIKDENFHAFQMAVVAEVKETEAILKVLKGRDIRWKSNRKGDWYMGSTLHCDEEHDFTKSIQYSGIVDEYLVQVTPFSPILEAFEEVEELHLLCEGEEIPIILKTPLDLLQRCKIIVSDFPWTYPHLHQTMEMENQCIEKLSVSYIHERLPGNRKYKFTRKDAS